MTKKITKAVFPVAGLGTRFLPATKASPKEMLPIVDKPLIQYAAEEAVAAGATELIFIIGRNKRSIPDHFDKSFELEATLEISKKLDVLHQIQNILPKNVSCIYIRQAEALGLGHAVLLAKSVVGNEPFSVILADDLIDAGKPAMQQMTELFEKEGVSILGVEDVEPSETASYGIVDATEVSGPNVLQLNGIVEKPQPEEAPSNLAVVGRYILTPEIFACLENVKPGKGGEIQLTDGIAALMEQQKILAYRFDGKRYDCGSKLGYVKANVEYSLKHEEFGTEFAQYLRDLTK
ncbi:UTP--glucose-1-phosphate uridylyltransferase GalU [Methylobacillus flagellatus]|uniref:UTP--glucose-1-phosphate uridylyltransferase GalU n=1 Tax=Methylobacillus flagellatus TaxID=405 RepID=UPI0028538920|nr:UTP--glucose-1-phosphate uridylyltransferase GalU [Methylobacillus flagellatus]MDR5171230.1 UTP--glucose-1-phosphate uridylyltransferase GalU [Methylobacillus flagellatus]